MPIYLDKDPMRKGLGKSPVRCMMKIIKAKDWLRKCRGTDSKIEAFIGLNYIYSNACAIAKDVMKTPKSFENIPIIIIGYDVRANK